MIVTIGGVTPACQGGGMHNSSVLILSCVSVFVRGDLAVQAWSTVFSRHQTEGRGCGNTLDDC